MKRNLLLFPDNNESAGGLQQVAEPEVVEVQPSEFEKGGFEQQAERDKPIDWDKEEGKPLEVGEFLGGSPKAKPEGEEIETEDKVEEVKQEQVDDLPEEKRAPVEVKETTKEEDPIFKRFPAAKLFLKKMSNEAREFTIARLNDIVVKEAEISEQSQALALAQQGKQKIPDNYYENPNAIVLLPEFQRASFNVNLAARIADHWNAQLESVLNGEEWADLEEIMDKSGNVVDVRAAAVKQPATGTAQAIIGKYVRQAERQHEMLNSYQEKLVNDFKTTVQAKIGGIRKAEDEFFPPERYSKEGAPEFQLTKQVSEGLKKIGITEANPAFSMLAKAGATILQLREYIQHNMKGATRTQNVADKAKQAGPTGKIVTGGAGGSEGKGEEDVMAEFDKILINKR